MLSQTLLASRLPALFKLNCDWVKSHLLPLLKWNNPNASALWRGYLWQFGISPDLWPLIKEDFLEAAHRFAGSKEETYVASYFTDISVQRPEWVEFSEAANLLSQITPDGRSAAARAVFDFLEATGDHADELWSDRVWPWLQNAWPRALDRGSPSISMYLSLAAIQTTKHFPEASDYVTRVAVPSADFLQLTLRIAQEVTGLPESHPRELLRMLDAVIDTSSTQVDRFNLGEVLDRIAKACPDCTQQGEYKRLFDFTQRP